MRKIALALAFILGLANGAAAQAPPPVPALPDSARITSYSISTSTCACSVGFQIYGSGTDVDEWIQVYVNGVAYLSTDPTFGWSLSSVTGSLGSIPRPITNAILTFNAAQTGTIIIAGDERPRRLSQFQENRGVTARDLNQAITDQVAVSRELWDKSNRTIVGQPGEVFPTLPPASARIGMIGCYDGSGLPTVCAPSTAGGAGILGLFNTWTATNTFAPSTVVPSIIVNAPNGNTAFPDVTINKGTGGKAALAIKNAVDNQGRLLSFYGPLDIATDTPAQYFTTGGFLTRLFIGVSGISSGTGGSYNITLPTADASMIACYADVAKCIQARCPIAQSFLGGGAVISMVSTGSANQATYVGADLCDGTRAWGSTTNTTFTGMDAFMGYGGTAKVQMGGKDVGNPVAQKFGAYGVAAPFSSNTGFSYGFTVQFTTNPAGVAPGQVAVDITNPACPANTTVSSVDAINNRVTLNKLCNPYQGDVFTFNGANPTAILYQYQSTRIGYGTQPDGTVVGQSVTDSSNPGAIPGGVTISSFDSSTLPGTVLVVLAGGTLDGATFNTGPGGHDVVVFNTPNTAAADFHLQCGAGTGTGNGGKCTIDAAPAGSTGSAQNTQQTYFTVDPNPATGTPEVQVAKGLKAGFYATAAPTTQSGATYSVGATDTDIIANRAGTITLTLPSAAAFVGRVIRVKTIQAQTVISDASNVAPMTSATPGTAILAATAGKWADLKSDGTNWIIMAGN